MSYTIQQAQDELVGMAHGVNDLSKVTNLYGAMRRAASNVISKIRPKETIRVTEITNPIHDQVYEYALPSDCGKIIDIRPQVNRTGSDKFSNTFSMDFDVQKKNNTFHIKMDEGVKTIRIAKEVGKRVVVAPMDSLTEDGTWAYGGVATALALDSLFYVTGSNSFKMALASGANTLSNSTMAGKDLSDYDEVGSFFVWVYMSAPSSITSLSFIFGNDLTTNYWTSATVTTQADGTAFRTGWNLVKFDWSTATETGTVDPTDIDAYSLTITAGATISDFRVDNIVCSLGSIFDLEYYSDYLFRTSGGTWIESPTDLSDIVNLGVDSINIWLYEVQMEISQQQKGANAVFDLGFARTKLFGDGANPGLYAQYRTNHPEEFIQPKRNWY